MPQAHALSRVSHRKDHAEHSVELLPSVRRASTATGAALQKAYLRPEVEAAPRGYGPAAAPPPWTHLLAGWHVRLSLAGAVAGPA